MEAGKSDFLDKETESLDSTTTNEEGKKAEVSSPPLPPPSPSPPPPKKELSAREVQARRSADGYIAMALAYSQKQDYETALKQTAKALKRDKTYPDTYVIQGQLRMAIGNVKEAVNDFLLLL